MACRLDGPRFTDYGHWPTWDRQINPTISGPMMSPLTLHLAAVIEVTYLQCIPSNASLKVAFGAKTVQEPKYYATVKGQ